MQKAHIMCVVCGRSVARQYYVCKESLSASFSCSYAHEELVQQVFIFLVSDFYISLPLIASHIILHTSSSSYQPITVPLLGKGLLSYSEGMSIDRHACSGRVGDFRLILTLLCDPSHTHLLFGLPLCSHPHSYCVGIEYQPKYNSDCNLEQQRPMKLPNTN